MPEGLETLPPELFISVIKEVRLSSFNINLSFLVNFPVLPCSGR